MGEYTVLGPDVSFYSDDDETVQRINFDAMRGAGADFVIIRAGQRMWQDPDFQYNWRKSKGVLPRGSYYFYDSRAAPSDQADLWVSLHEGDYGELPMWADLEERYGGPYQGLRYWKEFLERVKFMIGDHELGVYTNYYYFTEHVSSSEHPYFAKYPLWIANYGVLQPRVPPPWNTLAQPWLFWQFQSNEHNSDGLKFGCESHGIDKNYFNGDLAAFRFRFNLPSSPVPPVPYPGEIAQTTHNGIVFHKVWRHDCWCFVMVVDTTRARVFLAPGFRTVAQAMAATGAVAGLNAGGWANTYPYQLNEITASDGTILQAVAKDGRGLINVRRSGQVEIRETPSLNDLWNAWGYDRILGRPGTGFNTAITDLSTKDARTGSGYTADGKLVLLVAEGNDRYNLGLTFPQMWSVLQEFGAIHAGNNDGGSSSQMRNLVISPDTLNKGSDGLDAPVKGCVLLFAQPIGGGDPPAPAGRMVQNMVVATRHGDVELKPKEAYP